MIVVLKYEAKVALIHSSFLGKTSSPSNPRILLISYMLPSIAICVLILHLFHQTVSSMRFKAMFYPYLHIY